MLNEILTETELAEYNQYRDAITANTPDPEPEDEELDEFKLAELEYERRDMDFRPSDFTDDLEIRDYYDAELEGRN